MLPFTTIGEIVIFLFLSEIGWKLVLGSNEYVRLHSGERWAICFCFNHIGWLLMNPNHYANRTRTLHFGSLRSHDINASRAGSLNLQIDLRELLSKCSYRRTYHFQHLSVCEQALSFIHI